MIKLQAVKECLQHTNGPTPCFKADVKETVCSLSFCPVSVYLEQNPSKKPWEALNTHCVMSDGYGEQTDFEEGKGEFIATVARLRTRHSISEILTSSTAES